MNVVKKAVTACAVAGAGLVLAGASVLGSAGVALASGTGTVDQSLPFTATGDGIFGPDSSFPRSQAQTFTAGLTGGLVRVDLTLDQSATGDLTVQIRNTSGGAPGSTVLASATVPSSSIPSGSFGSVEIDFSSPAQVVSGTQYAIVAYTSDTSPTDFFFWGASGNAYSGGNKWFSSASPPSTWSEPTASFNNLAFTTYVDTTSALAAKLVSDTDHLKPGTALTDQAAAIQAAVTAGQTATACTDITTFLGLVKAQTGKKLSHANAALLTTDANNLAAALGC